METLHRSVVSSLHCVGSCHCDSDLCADLPQHAENREEDQIFLDAASQSIANEQRALVTRIEGLGKPITALIVLSSVLLVAVAGLWLWQGFQNFSAKPCNRALGSRPWRRRCVLSRGLLLCLWCAGYLPRTDLGRVIMHDEPVIPHLVEYQCGLSLRRERLAVSAARRIAIGRKPRKHPDG